MYGFLFALALIGAVNARQEGSADRTSAVALSIGLNRVDPKHYGGWVGQLIACEADARAIHAISSKAGFTAQTLLTQAATRKNTQMAIADAAARLRAGDIFVLSYAGHGGQVPDYNEDEPDGRDETWCLYDGQLLDDEIAKALAAFASGVRILVLSDSCHSETAVRTTPDDFVRASADRLLELKDQFESLAERAAPPELSAERALTQVRLMPPDVAVFTLLRNRTFYEKIGRTADGENAIMVQASVISLAACKDDETASDGAQNGLFTGVVKATWADGAFSKSYRAFYEELAERVSKANPRQHPRWLNMGTLNPAFEAQRPFTITPAR